MEVRAFDTYTNELEALRTAIVSEMTGQRIYARYAEEATNAEVKHFFTRLADYKAMHLQHLEAEMKALGIAWEKDGSPLESSGSGEVGFWRSQKATNDDVPAIDAGNGIDLTHCQLILSITENEVKMLEKANEEMLRKRLRHEQELAIAADIQRKLLPREFPQVAELQIAASNSMANSVGGDYYDLNTNQRGQLSLIVADSMGKGIPAALLMATVRAIWRGLSATCCSSPGQMLETINRAMYPDLKATDSFITMFSAVYDQETSVFQYSSAGHNPTVFFQASEPEQRMLNVGGLPVGIFPDGTFPHDELLMNKDDIIVMYTDGVVEAESDGDRPFGLDRLCDIVYQNRDSDADGIKDAILSELTSHTNGSPLADDTTILVLKKIGMGNK